MKMTSTQKYLLSMAGEYGVCSEISKRGINALITMGNAKAVDIFAVKPNGTVKTIEEKTTRGTRFVTGFFQKYYDKSKPHPDYWVLVYIDKNNVSHYYVLTHQEMGNVQMQRNNMSKWAEVPRGVDNVLLSNVKQFENQWGKI